MIEYLNKGEVKPTPNPLKFFKDNYNDWEKHFAEYVRLASGPKGKPGVPGISNDNLNKD